MPSSTSSSEHSNWGKSLLLASVISLLVLGALEICWRSAGHEPAIVDDQRLWAIERSKAGRSQKEIALLGSSRMQTDISVSTLKRLAPDYQIINLSADSTCANAVLHDLANKSNFRGTAIVETTSECLMFGDSPDLSQQFYVDYFHKTYNLNAELNRLIATFAQQHLAIIDPYLNIIKVAGDYFVKKKVREPNYLTMHQDRSRSADYSKLDIARHRAVRLQKIDANYRQLSANISADTLMIKISEINDAVKIIKSRGGKVFLIRFPVSDEHWLIDEKYFPRDKYWDILSGITDSQVIHFKDVKGMEAFQCPDTSHLDVKDTPEFTRLLLYELIKRNKD